MQRFAHFGKQIARYAPRGQTRRGLRKRVSIPVRLYLEPSSQTCAEEALVRDVSQHGAALTCSFPIMVGELVKIERMGIPCVRIILVPSAFHS